MATASLIKQSYQQATCSLFKHTQTGNVDANKHEPFGDLHTEVPHTHTQTQKVSNKELIDPQSQTPDQEAQLQSGSQMSVS